ncbi:MAG: MMPL family transporter [Candidatus Neomarinimicrobiota bacterium]
MLKKLTATVIDRPRLYLIAIVLITAGFFSQMPKLRMDPDITDALPQQIPAKRLYDKMTEIFPTKDFVFIGVEGEALFTPAALRDVWDLTAELENFPEVYQVLSPTNVNVISGTADGMEVQDILTGPPVDAAEVASFRERLFNNDLALGNLVSRDGKMFGIMLMLKNTTDDMDFMADFVPFIKDWDLKTDLTLIPAGKPVASYYVAWGVMKDLGMFFAVGILVIFLLLLAIYRNVRGVILPLLVVILSVLWTLGTMAFLGFPMSHSTEILPILIMAIAVADSIHIMTHYYTHGRKAKDRRELVRITMADMNAPVIMTSLTTMAGFMSLGITKIESIRIMGAFTALGVLYALLLSLTLVPAVLSLLKVPQRVRQTDKAPVSIKLMTAWGRLLVKNRKALYPLGVLVVVFAIWGFSRLEHSFSSIENFDRDHPVRVADGLINQHFAGTNSFQIMVEGVADDQMKDPRILADLDGLKQTALQLEHVGDARSLADFVKRFNKVLHGDDDTYNVVPAEQVVVDYTDFEQQNGEWIEVTRYDTVSGNELVAQYLTLYEMSGKPDDMASIVDYDYRNTLMTIFLNTDKQSELRLINAELQDYIDDHFENTATAVTGMARLILVVDDLVVSGQILSITVSLILVWLITSFMFKSPIIGLFNTIPLFFAMLLNFTVMGLSGINVNMTTMMTSSIAIGVGVDYAIHFMYRYRRKLGQSGDYAQAVIATMEDSGVAIAFNSLVVAAGFAVIGLSQFVSVAHLGTLIAMTMLTSAFGALTVMPLVFVNFKPKSLK